MKGLHESDSPVILENNLQIVLRRIKRYPTASDAKLRQKLLKRLSIFYKSITDKSTGEGSKRIMSKA